MRLKKLLSIMDPYERIEVWIDKEYVKVFDGYVCECRKNKKLLIRTVFYLFSIDTDDHVIGVFVS